MGTKKIRQDLKILYEKKKQQVRKQKQKGEKKIEVSSFNELYSISVPLHAAATTSALAVKTLSELYREAVTAEASPL